MKLSGASQQIITWCRQPITSAPFSSKNSVAQQSQWQFELMTDECHRCSLQTRLIFMKAPCCDPDVLKRIAPEMLDETWRYTVAHSISISTLRAQNIGIND